MFKFQGFLALFFFCAPLASHAGVCETSQSEALQKCKAAAQAVGEYNTNITEPAVRVSAISSVSEQCLKKVRSCFWNCRLLTFNPESEIDIGKDTKFEDFLFSLRLGAGPYKLDELNYKCMESAIRFSQTLFDEDEDICKIKAGSSYYQATYKKVSGEETTLRKKCDTLAVVQGRKLDKKIPIASPPPKFSEAGLGGKELESLKNRVKEGLGKKSELEVEDTLTYKEPPRKENARPETKQPEIDLPIKKPDEKKETFAKSEKEKKEVVSPRQKRQAERDQPEPKGNLTDSDVDRLTKAMDEAVSRFNDGSNDGFSSIEVGEISVSGVSLEDSSYSEETGEPYAAKQIKISSVEGSLRPIRPLFRGTKGNPKRVKTNPKTKRPASNNQAGLGGNPNLGGSTKSQLPKIKKERRGGKSSLWSMAKRLLSGSFFGSSSRGDNSSYSNRRVTRQKISPSNQPEKYYKSGELSRKELSQLRKNFHVRMPRRQTIGDAITDAHFIRDLYSDYRDNMLNQHGCLPPQTRCNSPHREAASVRKKKRK